MRLQSASLVSSIGANTATPALLTSASSRPKRRPTASIAAVTAAGIGDVASQRQRVVGVGECRNRVAQQFALDVEQRHLPALGEKAFCRRKPDAARGAGDQCDFLRGGGHEGSVADDCVGGLPSTKACRLLC